MVGLVLLLQALYVVPQLSEFGHCRHFQDAGLAPPPYNAPQFGVPGLLSGTSKYWEGMKAPLQLVSG
jgi:hypothetical protein